MGGTVDTHTLHTETRLRAREHHFGLQSPHSPSTCVNSTMSGKEASANTFITNRPSEASLAVQLHPLVLLTVTDYITRHISRRQEGVIIGAILGQQNGRSFTLEHAYECKTIERDGSTVLDADWFNDRLDQYRDVHKAPALDLVGTFMLGSVEGPAEVHAQVVKQVQKLTSSDSLMMLLFHPGMVDDLQGGKLPVTLYESVQDQTEGGGADTKFRELSFEVETGEAEMIGVDFVASGAGNATAVLQAERVAAESSSKDKKAKGKGKAQDEGNANANGTTRYTPFNPLTPEDEELLAALTAKVNAIKMLNERLSRLRAYLTTQPESYLTSATSTEPPPETTNHTLLRSINAMLSRLPLLANTSTSVAAEREKQDVHLTSLLASLTRSVSEAQSMGNKFHWYSREKQSKERGALGGGGRGGGRTAFGDDGGLMDSDSGVF